MAERDRTVEQRGHRHAVNVVADDQAAQLLEDQDESVGEQHLLEVVALVEMREQRPFEERAEQHRQDHAQRRSRRTRLPVSDDSVNAMYAPIM